MNAAIPAVIRRLPRTTAPHGNLVDLQLSSRFQLTSHSAIKSGLPRGAAHSVEKQREHVLVIGSLAS